MLSVGPILHCKVYAKFSSRGIIRGSVYIIMHASTSASELDIEISSVEHVQFIVGFFSDIRQSKIAFEGVRKILWKGGYTTWCTCKITVLFLRMKRFIDRSVGVYFIGPPCIVFLSFFRLLYCVILLVFQV